MNLEQWKYNSQSSRTVIGPISTSRHNMKNHIWLPYLHMMFVFCWYIYVSDRMLHTWVMVCTLFNYLYANEVLT